MAGAPVASRWLCETSPAWCCSRAGPASASSAVAPTWRPRPREVRTRRPRRPRTPRTTAGGPAGSHTTSGARSRRLPQIAARRHWACRRWRSAATRPGSSSTTPRARCRSRGDGPARTASAPWRARSARPGARRTRRSADWQSSLDAGRPTSARCERAIEYIRAGDVFQVNLSQRLVAPTGTATRSRCTRGCAGRSPAPFTALVRLGGADVVSASPERFLRACAATVETRPIKGTRPRSPDAGRRRGARRRAARQCQGPGRERDDRGPGAQRPRPRGALRDRRGRPACASSSATRACTTWSPRSRRRWPARLRPDVVRATFPPGSVTGAPKVRALEIIEELEPVRRGPYCGAIGWIRARPATSSCRSRSGPSSPRRGRLHLHAGGAVVADSDPRRSGRDDAQGARGCWQRPEPRASSARRC